MKRTTYIIIALFVSGILLIAGGIFSLFLANKFNILEEKRMLTISGEEVNMDLNGIHTIKLSSTQKNFPQGTTFIVTGSTLSVTPAAPEKEGSIFYPDNQLLHVTRQADTLLFELNIDFNKIPQKKYKNTFLFLEDLNLKLVAGPQLTNINNTIVGLKTEIKNLRSDSLKICSGQEFSMDSCQFRSLDINGTYYYFNFRGSNSKIENLYMDTDLNKIDFWDLNNCIIDTEHITGSSKNNYFNPQNCRHIIWTPKNKNAELILTLPGKAEIFLE